jgi:hypothetical protein
MCEYLLVEWVGSDPRQYLVCRKEDIVDKAMRDATANELVGKTLEISWKQKFFGKVVKVGKKRRIKWIVWDYYFLSYEVINRMILISQTKENAAANQDYHGLFKIFGIKTAQDAHRDDFRGI